jgi:hypothetical protein
MFDHVISLINVLTNPICQGHYYVLTLYMLFIIGINDFFQR